MYYVSVGLRFQRSPNSPVSVLSVCSQGPACISRTPIEVIGGKGGIESSISSPVSPLFQTCLYAAQVPRVFVESSN